MPASRFNPLRSLQRDLGRRAAERQTLTQGIAAHNTELQKVKEEMARQFSLGETARAEQLARRTEASCG